MQQVVCTCDLQRVKLACLERCICERCTWCHVLAGVLQAYIDFEIAEGERERTRALYERLLERTRHVKVCESALPRSLFLDAQQGARSCIPPAKQDL